MLPPIELASGLLQEKSDADVTTCLIMYHNTVIFLSYMFLKQHFQFDIGIIASTSIRLINISL